MQNFKSFRKYVLKAGTNLYQDVRNCSYKIDRIGKDNKERILKFMHEHFVYDEPLSNYLKLMETRHSVNSTWNKYLSNLLDEGTSLKCEQFGIITGAALCSLKTQNKINEGVLIEDEQFKKIMDIFKFVETKSQIYKTLQIDRYCYVDCYVTHRDYRRKRHIYLLVDAIHELAKEMGCKFIITIASSVFAREAAKHGGMTPIYSLKYEDYKVNGEIVFKTKMPHTEITVLAKFA